MSAPIDQLAALAAYQAQFEASIRLVDPDTALAWCGDWTVRDLVRHLTQVHHWAAGTAARTPQPPLDVDGSDLVAAYAAAAAELRAVLAGLDPLARTDTLLDDGIPEEQRCGTVSFWHRRQALETLVHLWDLRTAAGLDLDPGPGAWWDCLDEAITVMHARQVRLGRVAPPVVTARFVATDESADILLQGSPDAPQVVVSGPARSLALLVWGRLAATDPSLRITGDREGLDDVLAQGLTP